MERRQRIKIVPKDRTPYEQYTLTAWGDTPWPDRKTPSAAACKEVYARLVAEHGNKLRPAHITAPSLEVAGCGEVLQVLDAIVRTMISANTRFEYADAALQSLIRKAGVIMDKKELDATEHPELQHCLDYNYIRTSMTEQELQKAIAKAGNQNVTAGRILAILADVYSTNKERAEAFQNETPDNPADPAKFLAADLLSDRDKQWEIKMFVNSILNLEFLKKLSPEHAMNEMLRWKGIGVKTAACVLMFCMQEDIFACDTHCIRLSKWLGWVPVEGKDELVFAHVESRVPNHLKYALHQLFIQHGKDCIRCKDDSHMTKVGLEEAVCPLEDLLDRSPLRAYKAALKAKAEAKKDAGARNKSKTKIKMREHSDEWERQLDLAAGEDDIIENMTLITKKRTSGSVNSDNEDFIPAKHARATKKQPFGLTTTRRTRAQTKAEQEKELGQSQ